VDAFQRLSVLLLKIPVGGLTTRYFLGELKCLRLNIPEGKEKIEETLKLKPSVADPGCLSRIPDPDFYPSRIPDPKTATKERGKKNLMSYLFW
jgi:hypothetical protein